MTGWLEIERCRNMEQEEKKKKKKRKRKRKKRKDTNNGQERRMPFQQKHRWTQGEGFKQ